MSIWLIKERNLLTAQINNTFLADQRVDLEQLLPDVKNKFRSLRRSKKRGRRRWLLKNARNDFKSNPYNTGKTLLDPKCYSILKIGQVDLDQHKSLSLSDIDYNV